jgi:hypothetical protein
MRCFYQTIAHPRGGYLSTKLFIPRDVWRVKGVKLKNIEDKIANCDMLTAALQKLASVDTNDADAVLEEMQSLELVLDQVQTQLAKKLGNDVGVQSVTALFRDATTVGEGAASADGVGKHGSQDHAHKGAVAQGKSYLASWRKLRSKNSGVNLAGMAGGAKSAEVPKDTLVMSTLPMTNLPSIRFAKRDISGLVFEGPNAGYMGSLARLFDAVQILGMSSMSSLITTCILTTPQTKSPAKSKTQASSIPPLHTSVSSYPRATLQSSSAFTFVALSSRTLP